MKNLTALIALLAGIMAVLLLILALSLQPKRKLES
jgi:hypothetical protein